MTITREPCVAHLLPQDEAMSKLCLAYQIRIGITLLFHSLGLEIQQSLTTNGRGSLRPIRCRGSNSLCCSADITSVQAPYCNAGADSGPSVRTNGSQIVAEERLLAFVSLEARRIICA